MSAIIEWPYSQLCQDCKNVHWITPDERHPLTYPAAICEINHYPEGTKCKRYENQQETVELISAGYEWNCPACEQLNTTIEITTTVKCRVYQREYMVDNYEHAYQ
jgi:hypothetical protein